MRDGAGRDRAERTREVEEELLLDHVGPALRATGDLDRLSARSAHLLDPVTGADWQRAAYARSGNLRDVVLQAAQPV